MWKEHQAVTLSHLLDVFHVAVDSNQGEVILCKVVEVQRWIHVGLALKVLGPPLVDAPGRMGECTRCLSWVCELWVYSPRQIMYSQKRHTCHFSPSHRSLETPCHLEAFWALQLYESLTSHNWKRGVLTPSKLLPIHDWDVTFYKDMIISYNVSALVLSPMDSRYLA